MDFLIWLALWTLGLLLGGAYLSTVVLPLIYGLPKSLYLSLRGEMRWMAPLHYLLVSGGWIIAWTAIFLVIFEFFPESPEYLLGSGAFNFGAMLSTIFGFYLIAVSNSTNDAMQKDFSSFTERYVKKLVNDEQKYASFRACSEGMRNAFFFSIGGIIVTIIANYFDNNVVYFIYIIVTYIVLFIFALDIITKIFATIASITLIFAKFYHWFLGDISRTREFMSFADFLATLVALVLSALPGLVAYLSLSVVTPNHWNIFTFIGL